ncbi:uncharacterized protein LOC132031837 [Lycium ferocissimum]|uniref:uncharacterized protein LOC132031837 n=1 Tax=Lycium ferocissimum TaxID=112874 RepID=UPI002814AF58|nr:uncharacterized protein LOC132031837 [Lycium ferocissimum]
MYGCQEFDENDYLVIVQNRNSKPMPWIGLYVAAASFICLLAVAADVLLGSCRKKLWFPCKYFSLNAATLTLLAVAMKLPLDLNTTMWRANDEQTKLSSTLLMSTLMGNFIISLGSMENKDILANVIALTILLITIIVNICIQISTGVVDFSFWAEEISAIIFMLVLFLTFFSCALTVPVIKKHLESKYNEIHQVASIEELMEETGSLQFVIARSVTSTITDYKWSTVWILDIQIIGVVIGTVAPLFRWFIAVKFKCLEEVRRNFKNEFVVEHYWREKLEEWKGSSIPLQIRCRRHRKVLHGIKHIVLDLCIRLQVIVILGSKLVLFISVWLMGLIISCFYHIKRFKLNLRPGSEATTQSRPTLDPSMELDLSNYVMLLEGEAPLPRKVLINIKGEVDELIHKGKMNRPQNLIGLLRKMSSFSGVKGFDSSQVPSLQSKEPPNSWTLPVVTLASIAMSISSVRSQEVELLIRSMSESLSYARLVESMEKKTGEWRSIKNAADTVWVGVELHQKWLEEDLERINREGKTCKEIVQSLANVAKMIVMEFKEQVDGRMTENPLFWPPRVIAANSMYRISQTILLDNEIGDFEGESHLFEKISVLIADILAACFTNLPKVIVSNCRCNSIEARERSVRRAALLLGETEEILSFLQYHEFTGLSPDQAACIDEWRLRTWQISSLAPVSTINNETVQSNEHVVISIQ